MTSCLPTGYVEEQWHCMKKRWYGQWLKLKIAFCVASLEQHESEFLIIFSFGMNYPFKCDFSLEHLSSAPCIAYHIHGGTPSMFYPFQELGERVRFLRYVVCNVTLMYCSKTLFLADRRDKTIDWNVCSRYISQLVWTIKTADFDSYCPHRLKKVSLRF